jgi:hypothetical protein
MKIIFFALIALAIATPMDFVPVEGAEFEMAQLRSAFSDTITDCKVGKADFKPLKKDDADWTLEYHCGGGTCIIIVNFCQQTKGDCKGVKGVYSISVKGRDYCVVFSDTWEEATADETTYRGQYAVKIHSGKEDYHLTMVKNAAPLVYLSVEATNTMVHVILGSRYTAA